MSGAIRYDVSRAEYDAIKGDNWSKLKAMLRSPAHYRHGLIVPDADTDARKRGRAVHLAVLEPDRFKQEVVVWDGGTRRGKIWDAYEAAHADREILTEKEHALCVAISEAVRNHPVAGQYLSAGRAEVTLTWTASSPGVGGLPGWERVCKARPDFLATAGGGALVDLKSTRIASQHGFSAESHRYRYDAQAAFYSDAYEAVTGLRLPYLLVAVEAEAPYVATVFRVPDEILERGRKTYRECLERVAFCTRENSWPGYATSEETLELPPWVEARDDEDMTGLDLVIGDGNQLEA